LNRSTSNSRSRPPLFSVPPIQEEERPPNTDHPSDLEAALELSASRARSIELSRKVEQLTLQLEQERVAYASEYQALQRELQDTKNALDKCKGTVSSLEKEIAETEYNLVQARQKVSMLETYVVEDLVPPEDVIGECYASQGREFRRSPPTESGSDSKNEVDLLKKEAADLRGQLTVANTLVIKLEDDRSRQLKKISDLTELLQANKDSKKRLFEKSVECADLASERDLIKMQLDNLREKNTSLEMKLSETLDEIEELRISSASKSVRDFAIPADHLEERERTLNRVMETSIELAECKMKLDTVTEQLKAEQKKNLELAASIADLDRSSSMGGLRTRVSMPLNLSNHSPSQRGGRNLLGMTTGMLSNSYHGATSHNETTDVRRLQRTVAELEQQNEAYRLQVASLKQQSRMGTVQE
jgi:chromosome segregation ATPase